MTFLIVFATVFQIKHSSVVMCRVSSWSLLLVTHDVGLATVFGGVQCDIDILLAQILEVSFHEAVACDFISFDTSG